MSGVAVIPAPDTPNRVRASKWCRSLGVSLQTFHRWRLRPDGPPAYHIFGGWFVDPSEMEAWIANRSRRPSGTSPPPLSTSRRAQIQRAVEEARTLMSSR
jgi:hypothetical protein